MIQCTSTYISIRYSSFTKCKMIWILWIPRWPEYLRLILAVWCPRASRLEWLGGTRLYKDIQVRRSTFHQSCKRGQTVTTLEFMPEHLTNSKIVRFLSNSPTNQTNMSFHTFVLEQKHAPHNIAPVLRGSTWICVQACWILGVCFET